jgi:uncharacterized membrane protein
MLKATYIALLVLIVCSIVQAVVYYEMMPDRIASHFRPDGTPDGFSSKTRFLVSLVSVNVGTTLVLIVTARLIRRLPNSLINVPHKDYWLADERREESLAFVETAMLCTGILTVLLFMGIAHLTLLANQGGQGIPPVWLGSLIGGYIFAVMATTVAILARFKRPPMHSDAKN